MNRIWDASLGWERERGREREHLTCFMTALLWPLSAHLPGEQENYWGNWTFQGPFKSARYLLLRRNSTAAQELLPSTEYEPCCTAACNAVPPWVLFMGLGPGQAIAQETWWGSPISFYPKLHLCLLCKIPWLLVALKLYRNRSLATSWIKVHLLNHLSLFLKGS